MQSTGVLEPTVVSSSGQQPTSIDELAQEDLLSDSERTSNLAASEMQLWWREGTGYSGYGNVAVLLIKWADHLDQLDCGDEVRRLDELFQKSFRYHTKIVQLDDSCNVNLQLVSAFVDFLKDHDGPNNLIIVYYTGHGSQKVDPGHLVLHPTNRVVDTGRSMKNAVRAVWEDAEKHLMQDAKCDVLAILDCCFAGDVHKSGFQEDERTYQLLSAAGRGKTTGRPGPKSFTTALIKSLTQLQKEHRGKPFTTLQLQDCIQNQEERRNNPPFLWQRLHRYERPIWLAPLTEQSEKAFPNVGQPSQAFLTLRVALGEQALTKDQVTALGSKITKAAKSSGAQVRRVDLVGFSVSTRRRSLLQVVRNAALPSIRFKRGLKSDIDPIQTGSGATQLPTTPVSRSDSPPNNSPPPRETSKSAVEQIPSDRVSQVSSPRRLGKRKRSSTPEPTNKRLQSSA